MQTAPENWAELMAQPHKTETRVNIGGVSYYGYDGESGVWSLATRNALFENFSAGNCHAGTIDLTLVYPYKTFFWKKCAKQTFYRWKKHTKRTFYRWKKYSVDVTYTDVSLGETGTKNYSHVFDQETRALSSVPAIVVIDGQRVYDFSSGRQTVVQTNHTPVGTFCAANSDSIYTTIDTPGNYFSYYAKVLSISDNHIFDWVSSSDANVEIHGIQAVRSRGTYISEVESTSSSAYPQDGELDGFWYVYDGTRTGRGSYIEDVTSDEPDTYPQDGELDGFWYVYDGTRTGRGSYIEDVTSDEPDTYPQDGELDGFWYVYDRVQPKEPPIPTMAKMEVYVRLIAEPIATITIPKGRMRGDVNGNGEIDANEETSWDRGGRFDNNYILAAAAGKTTLDDVQFWCADANADGAVNSTDALKVIQRAGGNFNAYQNADYYHNWTVQTDLQNWAAIRSYPLPHIPGIYFDLPDGFRALEAGSGYVINAENPPTEDFTVKVYSHAPTEWVRKGVYYIDTREWDAQHEFLTITGFDAMLKAEQPYFTPPVVITGWPKTDATVVTEICDRIGVQLDSRTILSKGYLVQLPAVSADGSESMTLREVLGYVGGMYGGNWIINDEGKLQLVPLKPSGTAIDLGTSGIDLQTFPAYNAIGTVHLVVSEEQEYVAGTTGRSIEIQCPWGTQAMANALLTALSGYAYQPITVTTAFEADPLLELGDKITFNGVTSTIADVINNFSLAYTADISAPNGEELEHEYPFQDKAQQEIKRTVAKATASLRVDIDKIIAQVTDGDGNYTALTLKSDGLHIGNGEDTVTIDGSSITAGTVIAGLISADNILAGTISAVGQSINFRGSFNYYDTNGNTPAGNLGIISSSGIKYMALRTANSKASVFLSELDVELPTGPTGFLGLTGNLILKEGEHYGTRDQRESIPSPQIGQIFFVKQ